MRMFFVIDNNEPHASGGGYYAPFKFAEFLARRGHETCVHAVHDLGWSVATPGYRVRYRPAVPRRGRVLRKFDKWLSSAYDALVLEPAVRRFAPDWILGVLTDSAIKAEAIGRRLGIRVANFVYETPPWVREMVGADRFDREYRGYTRDLWERTQAAYQRSAVLFPNSPLAREHAARWLGREVAEPVYPGIDPDQMAVRSDPPGSSDAPSLLYVGRLAPNKNVDVLLRAWLRLDPRPRLDVCGEGPERRRLEAIVRGEGGVHFHGFVSDAELWGRYQRSDLVVVPSSFEGFGMPVLQALYFGKPCLASDLPVFRDVFGDRIDYFVDRDVGDLTRAIEALLANPAHRRARGEAGRSFVLQRFTWSRAAETIESILAAHPGGARG